ncbi:HAD family hydrolase [Amycolatopsis suaedae]|uniref:HAD family hydrolase n=1 Tax=Amycolatopsis suaedae TaxID=2510978 RepID=A0A4Q7JAP9_9PSEU|nr:haloacid dehalogenase-like hydrolase [Amycolatopsis suaedae]RZQ64860.1 HAD family hydrolase [Amycolatopsis suaedae]
MTSDRLVLWDIDLTLVDLRGLGGRWYREALATVAGIDLREMPAFPGRTELAITTELLHAHDVEATEETVGRIWAELIRLSEGARDSLPEHGHALPGAATTLAKLADAGVVQSLVTGNLPEIALHKLAAFDLHRHLDFDIGGYGSLSAQRPDLVAHAMELAERKHGRRFPAESVVVVGDTPNDVAAALAHGAVAVGVATGKHTEAELAESGAHAVFRDLSETGEVLPTLAGAL